MLERAQEGPAACGSSGSTSSFEEAETLRRNLYDISECWVSAAARPE